MYMPGRNIFFLRSLTSRRLLWTDLTCIVCVIAVGIMALIRVRYAAMGSVDESYQALCVLRWSETPVAMFSFWKAHFWINWFSDGYLSLRIYGTLITYGAVALTSAYCGWRAASWRPGAWMFVLCGLLACFENHIIYNWDVAPSVLYAVGAIMTIEYWRTRHIWKLCVLATVLTLLALSRIQLVTAVIGGVFFVWYANRFRQNSQDDSSWWPVLVYLFVCGATFWITTTVMTGSPEAYIAAWRPENVITGHGVSDIGRIVGLTAYNIGFVTMHMFISLMAVCTGIYLSISPYARYKLITGTIFMIFAGVAEGLIIFDDSAMDFGCHSAGVPVVLFLLLLLPFCRQAGESHSKTPVVMLVCMAVWWLLPAMGSDVFVRRLNGYLMIPLIVAVIVPKLDYGLLRRLMAVGAMCMVGFGTIDIVKTVAMPVVMTESLDSLPGHKGLYSSKSYKNEYMNVYRLYELVKATGCPDTRINFDGCRYLYSHTLQKSSTPNLHVFHEKPGKDMAALREPLIKDYDAWILCGVDDRETVVLTNMLVSHGFVCVYTGLKQPEARNTHSRPQGNVVCLRQPYARVWQTKYEQD